MDSQTLMEEVEVNKAGVEVMAEAEAVNTANGVVNKVNKAVNLVRLLVVVEVI